MLSVESVKFLKWLLKNDEWKYDSQLQVEYPAFEYRIFNALKADGYIDHCVDENEVPEYDEYGGMCYPEQYRISDAGRGFLDNLKRQTWNDIRIWVTFAIALAAFIKSFFFI